MSPLRGPLAFVLCGAVVACTSDAPDPGPDSPALARPDVADPRPIEERLGLDQRRFPLLVWAAFVVQQDYFDKGRFAPREQLQSAVDALALHSPAVFGARDGDRLSVTVRSQTREFSLASAVDLPSAADVLEEVLSFVADGLALEGEPLHELEYAAINGFFAPLDPHTILLTPEQHADLGVKTRGHFGGIGAEIESVDRRISVARVLAGSPAQRAGLLAGDLVLQIGDQSTVNLSVSDAQDLIRGPVGTIVVLKVRRAGRTLPIEVTRDTIKIESVESAMLGDGVGYVSISTFQTDTAEKVEQAVRALAQPGGLGALIFDVRGNSGGLLTQASGILDQLTSEGETVIVHSAQGRESEVARPEVIVPESTGVVVLVDEDSASAAEILGGSVKHLGRGIVLGRASFGKGTVQMLKPAQPYGRELALKLTVAEYRVAGDRPIQGAGVRPDVELVPVRLSELADVAAYFDDERFERARERARTRHLPSARHEGYGDFAGEEPPRLRYLDRPPAAGTGPAALRDREVRLALEFARAIAGAPHRKAMLAAVEERLAEIVATEDRAIVEALAARGIGWGGAAGEAQAVPLQVAARIEPAGPIPAGEPFRLHVAVTHPGPQTAHRVHLLTDCSQDELDGIEVLVGDIAPGQAVERTLELRVMPWHGDLTDRIHVAVHAGEPEPTPDGTAQVDLSVTGRPRPAFAFDWWIVDDPALVAAAPRRPRAPAMPGEEPFSVHGNGDGMLGPGERVLLAFAARNEGDGAAPDARAFVRNLSGAQGMLEEGLVELGALPPGGRASGAFGITVSPAADPAIPLELDLAVGDAHLRESARQKLRLRVLPERPAFAAERGTMRVEGESARAYGGADGSAPIVADLDAGALIAVVGRASDWAVSQLDGGRRVFVPLDLLAPAAGRGQVPQPLRPVVDPPRVELDPAATRVAAAEIAISGRARHAGRVRDVVITVKGTGAAGHERKVFYRANPEVDGPGAAQLDFQAVVPLEAGANRIVVIARDGSEVEARRDLLVWRE